jgi:MoxR-like ATPase
MISEMLERDAVAALPLSVERLVRLEETLGQVLRGKQDVVRLSLVCLLARGHLLIEDVPGVGKTTLANGLARSVSGEFQRLQFTSDMLPSDILGVTVYNAHAQTFDFKRGPVFTNFLLADEINRSTPKTQSALLEAMNELQVTIDGRSYPLEPPFMVIATQNPLEHHGTYPLPESQLDRFLLRLRIGYPDPASERAVLRNHAIPVAERFEPVLTSAEVIQFQDQVHRVIVDESLVDFMLAIVEKTRAHDALALGVSPRGAQALFRASQALALLEGRDYVLPDDIKRLTIPVFAHRVVVNTRVALAQRNTDAAARILEDILTLVEVPL